MGVESNNPLKLIKTKHKQRQVINGDKSRLTFYTFIFQIYVILVRHQNQRRQHSSTNQVTLVYIVLMVLQYGT